MLGYRYCSALVPARLIVRGESAESLLNESVAAKLPAFAGWKTTVKLLTVPGAMLAGRPCAANAPASAPFVAQAVVSTVSEPELAIANAFVFA